MQPAWGCPSLLARMRSRARTGELPAGVCALLLCRGQASWGKEGLLRRLLSTKSSVTSLLKRSSSSAVSLELSAAADANGALRPARSAFQLLQA